MCLNPHRIVNPSTWIDVSSTQSLFIDVPCGHCSECIVSYRNEWRNRAYYESLQTFLNGGYILFDTLTYSNGSLPHLSDFVDVPRSLDFPCFSYSDLSHFISHLRIYLSRLGYDVGSNLRYFIACEYGSDIRHTRRPHYHILFFVSCSLPFLELSKAISYCWYHGRTDGVVYRGSSYVSNNCVFTSFSDSSRFSVNYVSKYCTKNFSYDNLVSKRLNSLLCYDFNCWQIAKSYITNEHYQSKGFGNDALINIVGRDNLLNTGQFRIIQKNGMFRHVSLHKSLQRKLLYDHYRDSNGLVHFVLNEDGFSYKKRFFGRALNFVLSRVAGKFSSDYQLVKSQVHDLFFSHGRFRLADSVDDLIDNSYNIDKGLRNYSCVDYSFIRKRVFTGSDFGSKRLGFSCSVPVLNRVRSVPLSDSNQFIDLSDLKSMVFDSDLSFVSNYNSSRSLDGDGGLDVLKLIHRLNNLFKSHYV